MYDSITQNITKCQVPLLSYKNSGKTRWVVMPRIPPQAAKISNATFSLHFYAQKISFLFQVQGA